MGRAGRIYGKGGALATNSRGALAYGLRAPVAHCRECENSSPGEGYGAARRRLEDQAPYLRGALVCLARVERCSQPGAVGVLGSV